MITVRVMYDRDTLRVHPHTAQVTTDTGTTDGYFATVTTVAGGEIVRLYTTPVFASEPELMAWKREWKRELTDAVCLWDDRPLEYVTEVDWPMILGFCSHACHAESLRERDEMARYE